VALAILTLLAVGFCFFRFADMLLEYFIDINGKRVEEIKNLQEQIRQNLAKLFELS